MEMTVYSRMTSVVLLAAVVTTGLFLIMKVLVTGQEYEIEEELASIGIDFVRVEREEESQTKDRALKRPSKVEPEEPPPPPKLIQPNRPNVDKASMSFDMGAFDLAGLNLNAPVDGDTLAILRVLPRYPRRAELRGIEGWVLLEFDVDKLGQAINPVVI
jgi:protein TonB